MDVSCGSDYVLVLSICVSVCPLQLSYSSLSIQPDTLSAGREAMSSFKGQVHSFFYTSHIKCPYRLFKDCFLMLFHCEQGLKLTPAKCQMREYFLFGE